MMKKKIFKTTAAIIFSMLALMLAAGCLHGCVRPSRGFTSEHPFVYSMNDRTWNLSVWPFDIREQFSEINFCQDGLEWQYTAWASADIPQRYFVYKGQKYYILDNRDRALLLGEKPVVRIYRRTIGGNVHIGNFVMDSIRNDSYVWLQNHFLYSNFLYYHIKEFYSITTWFNPNSNYWGIGSVSFFRHSFKRFNLLNGESEQVDIEYFFDRFNPIFLTYRTYHHSEPEKSHPTLFINPSFA